MPTDHAVPSEPVRSTGPGRFTVGCILASAGRADDLAKLLSLLERQTRQPDIVIVSVPSLADAPPKRDGGLNATVVVGPRGLAAQRNTGLRHAKDCTIVVFFDDDFLPHPTYLERLAAAMEAEPDLLAADGRVVCDGAIGAGFDWEQAAARLRDSGDDPGAAMVHDQPDGLYGCNMAVRRSVLDRIAFDEALPLYSWLEDYDFSQRLVREGRIGRVMAARGVHLGVKRGRTSGFHLGYSQVANPLYLMRKGTMPAAMCLRHLLQRPAGNLWGLLRRDPHIDRAGRLRGNLLGFLDAVRGRVAPNRILTL